MKTLVLFCGAGGATEGLRRVGCEIVGAVDSWRSALLAHRRWHPRDWTVLERVERAHEIPWSPDLVWASPSCKPWSVANRMPKRGTAHPEYYSLAHLISQVFDAWKARWLIVENVCGLLGSKEGKVELQAMREAVAARDLRMTISVVNSNTCGVAQIRRRLFVVVGPEYVKIPHGSDYVPPESSSTPPMACEGAKGWPKMAERGIVDASQPSRHANWTGATKGVCANKYGLAQRAVARDDRHPHERHRSKRGDEFRDGGTGRTLAECCALQQVPEHVVAGFSKRVAHELIGNAVPPPLAEHVIRRVLAVDCTDCLAVRN